jgi:hypothetical protein
MRLLSSFLPILWLVAGAVSAQPPLISAYETQRARQLLNSFDWVDKAWGAYLAGRLHSADLDETLVEQLRLAMPLRNAAPWTGEHGFVAALFHAVIEGDLTVPSAVLDPFAEKWADPVLILLARNKDSDESLLRLRVDESRPLVWLAANNLLFERKSQSWYAGILGEISITHRFVLTDAGSGAGFGGGEAGGACGDGVAALPRGFPPVGLYTLQDGVLVQRGSVLLARGPRNVYYTRTVIPTDEQVAWGSCSLTFDRMVIRLRYLAQLRHESEGKLERMFHAETDIQYTTIESFERRVNQEMEAQEQNIRALIQDIERLGLSATNVHLRIVPTVDDRQQAATDSLPPLQTREIDLH